MMLMYDVDHFRSITEDVSRSVDIFAQLQSESVTTRKDWLTTQNRGMMTGESVTARRNGNRGRKGWQPDQCPL